MTLDPSRRCGVPLDTHMAGKEPKLIPHSALLSQHAPSSPLAQPSLAQPLHLCIARSASSPPAQRSDRARLLCEDCHDGLPITRPPVTRPLSSRSSIRDPLPGLSAVTRGLDWASHTIASSREESPRAVATWLLESSSRKVYLAGAPAVLVTECSSIAMFFTSCRLQMAPCRTS